MSFFFTNLAVRQLLTFSKTIPLFTYVILLEVTFPVKQEAKDKEGVNPSPPVRSNKGSFRLTAFKVTHIHGKFNFTESKLKTEKAIVTPFIRDNN